MPFDDFEQALLGQRSLVLVRVPLQLHNVIDAHCLDLNSSTADSRLWNTRCFLSRLVETLLRHQWQFHNHPVAQHLAQEGSNDDRNDDVPVEVHGQQHDYVSDTKSCSMDGTSCDLLCRRRTEGDELLVRKGRSTRSIWTTTTGIAFVVELGCNVRYTGSVSKAGCSSMELTENVGVVLFADPS